MEYIDHGGDEALFQSIRKTKKAQKAKRMQAQKGPKTKRNKKTFAAQRTKTNSVTKRENRPPEKLKGNLTNRSPSIAPSEQLSGWTEGVIDARKRVMTNARSVPP